MLEIFNQWKRYGEYLEELAFVQGLFFIYFLIN